jgi:chromosomal replication initiator protein
MDELCGDRRSQNIVYPRRSRCTSHASSRTRRCRRSASEFGGRDHTTVIHATSKIARMIREDSSVYNLVQELTARIKQSR